MENRPYIIVSDTTCDLPEGYVRENGLGMMAISYEMDGVEYDGMEHVLPTKDFYDKMRAGSMPKTQQINPIQSGAYFTRMIEQGYDVLYIAFSSALSGTYQSALNAREEVLEKHPGARIEIFDSLSASVGEGLQVHKALQLKQGGASMDEVLDWLRENVQHLSTYFTVDDLFHLHRGGRVSKTAAVVGSMLGIKPVLYVSPEGKLEPTGKVRGRRQSLSALADHLERLWLDRPDNDTVFISHGDALEDAQLVASMVKERLKPRKLQVMITEISPCIGTHSGPGTIAMAFLGGKR